MSAMEVNPDALRPLTDSTVTFEEFSRNVAAGMAALAACAPAYSMADLLAREGSQRP